MTIIVDFWISVGPLTTMSIASDMEKKIDECLRSTLKSYFSLFEHYLKKTVNCGPYDFHEILEEVECYIGETN